MIKRLLKRLLKSEFEKMQSEIDHLQIKVNTQEKILHNHQVILGDAKVGVDVGFKEASWAAISIQGKVDYVKFVNLGRKDAEEIATFLRMFDRRNVAVDAPPQIQGWIKSRLY